MRRASTNTEALSQRDRAAKSCCTAIPKKFPQPWQCIGNRACGLAPLDKMVGCVKNCAQMWLNRSHTREQLAADASLVQRLSGYAALEEFSLSCDQCERELKLDLATKKPA